MILRELEMLAGFIISGLTFNNISYADGTVLIAGHKRKTTKCPTECSEGKLEETKKKKKQWHEKKICL